jgi:hypothetical protein
MMKRRKMLTAIALAAACLMLLPFAPASFAQDTKGKVPGPPPPGAAPTATQEAPGNEIAVSPDSIKQDIRRILDRPDFRLARETQTRPIPKWIQWIKDTWRRMWDHVSEGGTRIAEGAPWIPYAVMAIAGGVLLLMTWRIISESFFEGKVARAGKEDGDKPSPGKLMAAAAAAYADGDVQRAIRLLFSAAILSLFGEAARTTPTYLLAAKLALSEGAPIDDFRQLKRSFELTFYGGAQAGRIDYENARLITMKLRKVNEEAVDEQ